ncbi:transcriptional regulator SdiA [Pseudomonas sp. MPR-R2A7]|uniref:LuxR family transcriptional regulator n=2 Tax=Pseudomonas fluorescens group TaxID=136843 RepID=A0A5M8FAX0_PSEVE|nr:LuxR family transcriptional regulator [Pseudomonas veronii]PMX21452.1 transcriptional regulator SdiA [Pseudomonas sp. GW460-12]PMX32805.1 transcriptional regulator SdiA [Pseudomonas sp. MPR-R2A4]PMX39946.1 transcriptional regulator SdiA [Pseudomonas sp. MPR-R2A7]PMX51878.1 transcriptional regulator SdiA [Pseudomonas sp. MPR-R2A6]PMX86010.1 transcriptional regulator SdiA [Pseudomonas sp. MPR-R2A3]PMY11667.1 transcriptional regulator SdiA [Pseudomonas sp. MPR-R2A5]PNA31973.1 transcriptional
MVKEWRETLIEAVSDCATEHELFNKLHTITSNLGFEFCSYGLKVPLPSSASQYVLISNYPRSWEQKYVSENYFSQDPTVAHGLTRSIPLHWSAAQQQQHLAFWEEARHYQLNHGWCLSSQRGPNAIGLLSVSRSSEYISTTELEHIENKLIWLTQLAHESMTRFFSEKCLPDIHRALTAREKETLRWTALGKTYVEISMILNIDTRTVKFHLVNAMRKLQASNKAEAAVKASLLGLLF